MEAQRGLCILPRREAAVNWRPFPESQLCFLVPPPPLGLRASDGAQGLGEAVQDLPQGTQASGDKGITRTTCLITCTRPSAVFSPIGFTLLLNLVL